MSPVAAPDSPAFVADAEGQVPLTAERFFSMLRRALAVAGVDSWQYKLHSFRQGGVSWAYQCGMAVDTICQIGDWRSNAYQKCILPTSDSLKVAMTAIVNPYN